MSYVDLTMPITAELPVFPGDPRVKIETAATIEADGYLDHVLTMGTHNGTHLDAPAHMIAGGRQLSSYQITDFVGPARLLDIHQPVTSLPAEVAAGDIVLLYSGISQQYQAADYFDNVPIIPPELVQALIERRVKMVGVDAGSIDGDPFTVHKKLLGAEILIIENLISLEKLAGKEFSVMALPLTLANDGAPARVIARIRD